MSTQPASLLHFGARLRHSRLLAGLKLKEVARRAHCSESLLSRIENDKTRPSLATLHRIVEALGTNISALLDAQGDEHGLVMRAGRRPIIATDGARTRGAIQYECLIPHEEGRLLQASIHIVAPGCGTEESVRHRGEEVAYVLEGSVELTVNGKIYAVEAGDSFTFRSELVHGYRNKGETAARILWVNTPPTF